MGERTQLKAVSCPTRSHSHIKKKPGESACVGVHEVYNQSEVGGAVSYTSAVLGVFRLSDAIKAMLHE